MRASAIVSMDDHGRLTYSRPSIMAATTTARRCWSRTGDPLPFYHRSFSRQQRVRRNYNSSPLVEILTRKYFFNSVFGTMQTRVEYIRAENWVGTTSPIHRKAEGERRSSRDSRKRSCALRLFHRRDPVSGIGAGGFRMNLAGRWRPCGLRYGGHEPGRDGADEANIWASSSASRTRQAVSMTRVPKHLRSRRAITGPNFSTQLRTVS
jgi:hypothetical protein